MKGKMKARLHDCSIIDSGVYIDVVNLDSSTDGGQMTRLPLRAKAIQKLDYISPKMQEDNDIILSLDLVNNLSSVKDFTAKINGINVEFPELKQSEPKTLQIKNNTSSLETGDYSLIKRWLLVVVLSFIALKMLFSMY